MNSKYTHATLIKVKKIYNDIFHTFKNNKNILRPTRKLTTVINDTLKKEFENYIFTLELIVKYGFDIDVNNIFGDDILYLNRGFSIERITDSLMKYYQFDKNKKYVMTVTLDNRQFGCSEDDYNGEIGVALLHDFVRELKKSNPVFIRKASIKDYKEAITIYWYLNKQAAKVYNEYFSLYTNYIHNIRPEKCLQNRVEKVESMLKALKEFRNCKIV